MPMDGHESASLARQGGETLLLVEDDSGLRKQLRWGLDRFGVQTAENRLSALSQVRRFEPAVVLLDLGLPPDENGVEEGLATLEQILDIAPSTKVIVFTGNQHRENAVRAVALGAYDFCQKPLEPEVLAMIVDRAMRLFQLERENRALKATVPESGLSGIVTADPHMLSVCRNIEKVAPSETSVLVLGESGTGKEVIVRALHRLSARSEHRLAAINCAAIPENLLESELFGYEKGAFSGAAKQTQGKIEAAHKGTLFLDEIGDMPLPLQAKLLRFLQERVVERLGGREEIPVDVRVVCATNRDLQEMIKAGTFREDLYYRLSEISIKVPPLRERSGDAVLLAKAFLGQFSAQHNKNFQGFRQDALSVIMSYPWPGNIREMENVIKRVVVMAEGPYVNAHDLGLDVAIMRPPVSLRQAREEAERKAVVMAMAQTNGNILRAANLLGITRPTMYDLLNQFGLRNPAVEKVA
jgi:two-component system NtrC family response regulator